MRDVGVGWRKILIAGAVAWSLMIGAPTVAAAVGLPTLPAAADQGINQAAAASDCRLPLVADCGR